MESFHFQQGRKAKPFYWLAGATIALVVLTANQTDPSIYAAGMLLALLSISPFYFWFLGWSHGLPIWPVFCLANGLTAALPLTQDHKSLDGYSPAEIIIGGMTWAGFIVLGTIVWSFLSSRKPSPPKMIRMISRDHAERYLFWFVAAGLLFGVNSLHPFLPLPGNTSQLVRGVSLSLSWMGVFVLCYNWGQGGLSPAQKTLLVAMIVVMTMIIATGLILASAVIVVALAFLGYALGSGKLPWKTIVAVMAIASVLHAGKFDMRDAYWIQGKARVTLWSMPAFYGEWAKHGVDELGGFGNVFKQRTDDEGVSSLFERGGTLHMLLLVQRKTPSEVPFFNGTSYEFIPRLLVPRFIDDQKGGPHAANIMLTVNYGLQTLEQTQTTSIGWGLVPEAYANFGYLGVAVVAVAVSAFYAFLSRMTVGVPMTSLRFVVGLLIMAVAIRADTMALFVTMQFQSVMGVSLAAVVLMRRQRNPLAEEVGGEGIRHTAEGAEHGAWSRVQGTVSPSLGSVGQTGGKQLDARPPTHVVTPAGQVAADGGVVRTLPIRTPKRIASWMPRRVRAAVVAEQRAAAEGGSASAFAAANDYGVTSGEQGTGEAQNGSGVTRERPRQVAVPYRNYRRYRG